MKKGGLLPILLALGTFLALAAACGGGGDSIAAPTVTTAPATSTPTSAPETPTPTTAATSTPTPTIAPPTQPPTGNGDLVARGRELYLNVPDNAAPQALWCYQCHFIEGIPEAAGLIGPDHTHIGRDPVGRIPGLSAEEYLRQSIQDPEAHVAEGVERATPGLMTNAITEDLTNDQVDALVAFLLTQK